MIFNALLSNKTEMQFLLTGSLLPCSLLLCKLMNEVINANVLHVLLEFLMDLKETKQRFLSSTANQDPTDQNNSEPQGYFVWKVFSTITECKQNIGVDVRRVSRTCPTCTCVSSMECEYALISSFIWCKWASSMSWNFCRCRRTNVNRPLLTDSTG